jgi:hypothetical protein
LDGLPLAIELAAARSGQLGAVEVARRLSDRFQLLTGSRRRVPRQRTLEATLDWSYDHLTPDEQRALRGLAVFTGTFSLRAAERVTGAAAGLIGMLVDKSLVNRGEAGRFRLLETVRAYAEDRLVDAGDAEAMRQAHVRWLLEEIEEFTDEEVLLATSDRSDEFVTVELDNLYLAMAWTSARSEWTTVARLATYAGLAEGLIGRDSFRSVGAYLRECLENGVEGPLRDRALAAYTAVSYLDPPTQSEELLVEAAQRAWDGRAGTAVAALTYCANMLDARSRAIGDTSGIERATRLIERASDMASDVGPPWRALVALFQTALALSASDWERAADRSEALRDLQQHGAGLHLSAWAVWVEAAAELAAGRPLDRVEIQRRLSGVRRRDPGAGAEILAAAFSVPDPTRPREPIDLDRASLDRCTPPDANAVLIAVATLAARDGDWPIAVKLLAAARGDGGVFASVAGLALYRLTTPLVKDALDKPVRDALIDQARVLGHSHAIDLAIEWLALDVSHGP